MIKAPRRLAVLAEFTATAFLLIAVVGSGIAAERLSGGNSGLALLANALATAAALFVLILVCAPLSGAHMNPAVTLTAAVAGGFSWAEVPAYAGAQIAGAVIGTFLSHAMFDVPVFEVATHVRSGAGQWLAEAIAAGGLLGVIRGCMSYGTATAAAAVAAYIGGAYWFTASTSFANPAVTLARMLTDTFSGIRPIDAGPFIAVQLLTAGVMAALFRTLRRAA
ncbi:MAG: aquaporin [Rhodospirillaceae bacterium]|nr:aquaporin [Rhodospirillaceae bacterium]